MTRIAIDPVTRVEGHGKITLQQDDDQHITQARLHIAEFRGFEKFIQGRPYWEVPVLVQRLCGICPVSHHLAAAKASDRLLGIEQIPPTAEKMRKLMHFGQTLQSHALHFFHLSSPDLLFGYDDEVRHRNIIGVIQDHPELAKQGVLLRKYGQEVIRVTAGKRIHGTGAIPGGINKNLSLEERDYLLKDIDQMVAWAQSAVGLFKNLFYQQLEYHQQFATIDSNMLGLVQPNGALELYDGGLRARAPDNSLIFDHQANDGYLDLINEHVESWSYMKFPFIRSLGVEQGWYRVGPLARINNCDSIDTELAELERQEFKGIHQGQPVQYTLAYHWARLIELLHCAEAIKRLLDDPELQGQELTASGELQEKGIGIIEAPRGTLIHHYEVNEEGLITRANLIVSTTHNNQAMNESIRQVAEVYLDGQELTEPLLNQLEVAVRAYDPCLSCATHALGQMPLQVTLKDSQGRVLQQLNKSGGDAV
jgi:NAD-reducing hydrogenase large subunit